MIQMIFRHLLRPNVLTQTICEKCNGLGSSVRLDHASHSIRRVVSSILTEGIGVAFFATGSRLGLRRCLHALIGNPRC